MAGSGIDVKIPPEELNSILSKAILDSLSQETRDNLISGALRYLMAAPRDRYGSAGETPLQEAFNLALRQLAHKVAEEVLAEQGAAAKLRESFTQFIEQIPDIDSDWELQTAIFRAILERVRSLRDR